MAQPVTIKESVLGFHRTPFIHFKSSPVRWTLGKAFVGPLTYVLIPDVLLRTPGFTHCWSAGLNVLVVGVDTVQWRDADKESPGFNFSG